MSRSRRAVTTHLRVRTAAAVVAVLGVVSVYGGGAAVALWSVSDARITTSATTTHLTALPAPTVTAQTGGSWTVDVGAGRSSATLAPVYTLERSTTADFASPVRIGQGASQTFTATGSAPPVATPTRFSKIVVGSLAGCGLTGGRAMCWGTNTTYQFGRGDTVASPNVPVPVKTTADDPASQLPADEVLLDIVAGIGAFCATSATSVYCWGNNESGIVDPTTRAATPLPVKVLTRAATELTSITIGRSHACVLLTPGGPYCWGGNESGQLGANLPLTTAPHLPVKVLTGGVGGSQVPGGTTPTVITAGVVHTCLITSGKAYCWGRGAGGSLGTGANTDASVPQAVLTGGSSAIPTTAVFTSIATSPVSAYASGNSTTCAIASDIVFCWGDNENGGLGIGTTTATSIPWARQVVGLPAGAPTSLSAAAQGNCVIVSGVPWCWGWNNSGQLLNGGTTTTGTPVKAVIGTRTATSITGTVATRCVGFSDGAWGCAGYGGWGAFGEGPNGRLTNPTTSLGTVVTPSPLLCAAGTGWVPDGTCALAPGTVYYYRSSYTLGSWTSPVTGPVGVPVS